MKIDRRTFINFDWVLLALIVLISGIGIVNLYSTGNNLSNLGSKPLYIKQIYWIAIGLVSMIFTFSVDYRFIVRYAYVIYAVSLLFLLTVFLYGEITHGSQRWLSFGGISFQPSELVKLTLIVTLSKYLSDHAGTRYRIRDYLILFAIIGFPAMMIIRQPDLGTSLFLVILFFSIVVFWEIKKKLIIFIVGTGFFFTPFCWYFMKDYQKERVLTFLSPERDPLGAGYHIIQSIIAIGSGGWLGKGFLRGTQSQLKFLPEQQTDFVFSVFAEEWGFCGAVVLLLLFLTLMLWGIKIARNSRDLSGMLLAYGATVFIFWAIFINMGMVLGILPVVGIPLPFLSYGGSSMVVTMTAVGLLMNVSMRRYVRQP